MISNILELLELHDYKGVSKNIDMAKGINKLPLTFKQGWKQYKRQKAWRLKSK